MSGNLKRLLNQLCCKWSQLAYQSTKAGNWGVIQSDYQGKKDSSFFIKYKEKRNSFLNVAEMKSPYICSFSKCQLYFKKRWHFLIAKTTKKAIAYLRTHVVILQKTEEKIPSLEIIQTSSYIQNCVSQARSVTRNLLRASEAVHGAPMDL